MSKKTKQENDLELLESSEALAEQISKGEEFLRENSNMITYVLAGIAIVFMANSVNYTFVLFADTNSHEIALTVPIIATALFTIVWGDATLKSQVSHIKDATDYTKKTNAYLDISSQPYNLLRVMNLGLAVALAASQLTILFS